MQENILNAFADQAKSLYTPFAKFNGLFVENVEQITALQISAIKAYAELGINQLKKAAEIKDADSIRAFTTSQAEAASALNKKVLEDAKAFSDIATKFKEQVEGLVDEARSSATATKAEEKSGAKKTASAV